MAHFFSCDWGTTSFRLRLVNAETGSIIKEQSGTIGVRALFDGAQSRNPADHGKVFAAFLRSQLLLIAGASKTSLDGATVMISGMASSSIGWRELPYAHLPMRLDGSNVEQDCFDLDIDDHCRARICLISGVCDKTDIMRGEETEIIGLFSAGQHAQIAEDGILVIPGTHSKHVQLRQGQIIGFRTYMTGELFDVLSAHSVLRASVQPSDGGSALSLANAECLKSFTAGVGSAVDGGLARNLFQTRVRTVLEFAPPAVNRWFLSGLLIGSEIADLAEAGSNVPILLAAVEPLHTAYRSAFQILGLEQRLRVVPAEEMAHASVHGHQVLLRAQSLR